jgi:hypothetical protein
MKDDDDRTAAEQILKSDQLPLLVGHDEQRHRLANLRRTVTGPRSFESADETIDGRRENRAAFADQICDCLQPVAQRNVAAALRFERIFKLIGERAGHAK